MDTNKLLKMTSADFDKEISAREKKIKTLKSEIALLKKLRLAENAKTAKPQFMEADDQEGQQEWPGTTI